MRFFKTLTITEDDGRIIKSIPIDAPEAQLILGLADMIPQEEHTHEHTDEEGELRGGDPSGAVPATAGVPESLPAEASGSDRQG